MKYLQYNLFERETKNASGKAKNDVSAILRKLGFQNMYNPCNNAYIRLAQQFFSILGINKDTFLVVQYPANLSLFYRLISKKQCYKVAIVHDLESLRGFRDIKTEISILNSFDVVISHNYRMTKYLEENGLVAKILDLQIFDYLLPNGLSINKKYNKKEIAFAGNLEKSKFLYKLKSLIDLNFNIYGIPKKIGDSLSYENNMDYKGSFPADKLIEEIQGGWGLVWDGNSIDTCNGINGEYMRYNCPHKVSMYIIAERPIIIWKEAAMAKFVKENNLGIVISSLSELPSVIKKISDIEYEGFLDSVRNLKEILVKGNKLGGIIKELVKNIE